MKILKYPCKELSTKCEEVTEFDQKLQDIAINMVSALAVQERGERLGLAANQIGILKRVCIVKDVVMVNPEFTPAKAPKETRIEGCYSADGSYRIERAPYGWAKWKNLKGEPQEAKLNDDRVYILQHELDHLDGITCCEIGVKVEDKKEIK